jgi:hypothetical protein
MRVSIERGFHAPIQQLMGQLQTDDPKLAIHHIIGCWLASNGCPGHAVASVPSSSAMLPTSTADDEFADIIEF